MNAKSSKSPSASAPEHLEILVRTAERAGASDVHLQMVGKIAEVAFRLDGVMTPTQPIPEASGGTSLWPH